MQLICHFSQTQCTSKIYYAVSKAPTNNLLYCQVKIYITVVIIACLIHIVCVSLRSPHLSLGGLCLLYMLLWEGAAVVPPGKWRAEPLHLTQVDEEGTV